MNDSKRPQLLPEAEVNELYARPVFNKEERKLYFELTAQEKQLTNLYTATKTRIYFILQLGYFKAKQQFFKFNFEDVPDDVEYITNQYFEGTIQFSGCVSRNVISTQKDKILSQFSYKAWNPTQRKLIEDHLLELLRFYPQKHNAMRQLLLHFEQCRLVIPSYRIFQDMYSSTFNIESKRLDELTKEIPECIKTKIDELTINNDGITELNLIRQDPKDFQCMVMREEADKAQRLQELYDFASSYIPKLDIAKNAVRYYAQVTEDYPAARLRKLKLERQRLYMICFIYHRYQQIIDNLIGSFIYRVRLFQDAGKEAAELAYIKHHASLSLNFPGAAKFMQWFPTRDKTLSYDELNDIAYGMLPESEFSSFAQYLDGIKFDKKAAIWEFYENQSRSFALYLRPILLAVKFEYFEQDSRLMEMINLLREHYQAGKAPKQFKLSDDMGFTIPQNMIPYLKTNQLDQYVAPHLFEFYVYERMLHQLDKGRLYCNDSISYCDLDNDLVPDALVDQIDEIANKFGYDKLPGYCDEHLDNALSMLDQAWKSTINRIKNGENSGIKIKDNNDGTDWTLTYDGVGELDIRPLQSLPKTEISELLLFIGHKTNMWSGFTHKKSRYVKKDKLDPIVSIAALLSQAFGLGEEAMSEMSDLPYNLLRHTRENFIRVETMCTVNDLICNYTSSLPIYKKWNLLDDKLLADADGQKFSATGTIQSRYSKKYIGKGRGISLYTLTANYIAVNAKNIGLNEYEGHSLFDMVFNNKTDVVIDAVTGDNHSINKTNYVILDAIDVNYMPGIKNIKEAAKDLYSVDDPSNYEGIITPKGKINPNRIRSQKRMLLRILLSLIMQENTQTQIIRKLNSCDRYASLRAAIFEYNKIFKSAHILNLINDMSFRKAIRTARNRTESYHQLQQCIKKVHNGVFKGRKIVDNRISAHAVRLIANCIMAYNTTMLNAIYEKVLTSETEQNNMSEFLRISPIAWSYLLFTGQYSFKNNSGNINIDEMTEHLENCINASD